MYIQWLVLSLVLATPCAMAATPGSKPSGGQTAAGKPSPGKQVAAKPAAGKPAAGKPAAAKLPPVDQLPALCREAKKTFRPLAKSDVAAARKDLVEAVGRLERKLKAEEKAGEADIAELKEFLLWSKMRKELARRQPDLAALGQVYAQYCSGRDGLAKVWFADVRLGLQRCLQVALALENPNLRADYEATLDTLATRLTAYIAQPTAEEALEIGPKIGWLEDLGQAPLVVKAVRYHLARPNLLGRASAGLVAAGIGGPVKDTRPICDCIMGTEIFGTAHSRGNTTVKLVPNTSRGIADTTLRATALSDTVGIHGKLSIYSTGVTGIYARKRLLIDVNGLAAQPATACADTSTSINDIQHCKGRRLIERMAWKRAGKQQGTAEYIASRHTEAQVSERVNAEAAQSIHQANNSFNLRLRNPLVRYKVFPQMARFSTTEKALHMVTREADPAELAAATAPPALSEQADLVVQVHESMINNLATTAMVDMSLTKDECYDLVLEVTRDADKAEEIAGGGGDWLLKFAHAQPLSVKFADNGVRVVLRGQQFYQDTKTQRKPHDAMNVAANYQFVETPEGFKAVRQGPLEILPPRFEAGKGKNLSAEESATVNLLDQRFKKIFKEEYPIETMVLKGKWSRAGKLRPFQLICENGWLAIAWRRIPPANTVAKGR